ncbi:peptidase S41 [Enterococcus sp. JM4C]|uniref:S41 family peptidase n=1 Tax=Candidatus Enterococcus huntleyi TaxID=1857217 RepID=UPI0013798ABE|nr:S41 family peptidase [Enterococcus sp. JM4C]KAF1298069.1 peptidase S41 [Enterococcus sp. JM4C]
MSKHNQFISFNRYIVSMICIGIISGGSVYIVQKEIHLAEKNQANESAVETDELKKVHALYDEINDSYVEEVKKDDLIEGALKGMTEALDDPYSSYLDSQEATDLTDSLAGSFEGIGAVVTIKNEQPTIAEAPVKGSPAEKVGLKAEDIILKVDGQATEGKTLSEVVSTIRGEKGTEVTLTIQRAKESFVVTLKRDTIPQTTVKGTIDEKNKTVGSIQISAFGENTAKELKETIQSLRKDGAKAFVIDLRDNTGGLLNQVEEMSSMFLKDGKMIVQFSDKEGNKSGTVASKQLDGGFKVTEPVAVLVNGYSASASEIFAAALNESAEIPLIGTKTFGKGTVQTVRGLDEESEIKLTVMKWLTPKGEWIHKKGIEPTIEADYPEYAYSKPISRERTWEKGDTSPVIENLNKVLAALDYDTNGQTFDEKTVAAVSDFQRTVKHPATGKVDDTTATALEAALRKLILANDKAYLTAVDKVGK